jgi:pyruvate ferredoxin oxidoreductase gamma subunit
MRSTRATGDILSEDFMKEIRIHGRGGQGSLVLAQFMAIAALSDRPVRIRSRVDEPDYLIVQDATIFNEENILEGLKEGGMILVNTGKSPVELGLEGNFRVFTFSADDLARSILGRPIMNTALLGAFAAVTRELSLEAVLKAVRSRFPGELGEKNARVVEESYKRLTGEMS